MSEQFALRGKKPGPRKKSHSPVPRKVLAQHWLTRPELAREIADQLTGVAAQPGWSLVEVGPGPGVLTGWLVQKSFREIHLVEKDETLAQTLSEKYAADARVVVHPADILNWPWPEGFEGAVAGNLPYYLTGKFLRRLYGLMGPVQQAVFVVLKEVAQRLTAPVGRRERGLATVLFEAVSRVSLRRVLKPGAFHPPPTVDSAVVLFQALPTGQLPAPATRTALERVVDLAFSQRRKKALPLISKGLSLSPLTQASFFTEFQSLEGLRAEAIPTDDFLAMTRWLEGQGVV